MTLMIKFWKIGIVVFLMGKCLYPTIMKFCFASNRRWNFLEAQSPSPLIEVYLKGVFSTNFKMTDWMIPQQSALNFLVFNSTLSKQFVSLLLHQFCLNLVNCLYPSTNLSLVFYLYLQRQPLNLFCRLESKIWEKPSLGHQREIRPKQNHFGKQLNSSQIWRQ